MADFAGYRVDALSDEELLARALAVAGKMTPERIETARDAGTPEEMAAFPGGDQLARSNYGKLPGVREAIGLGRIAAAGVRGTAEAARRVGRTMDPVDNPRQATEDTLALVGPLGVVGGISAGMGRMMPDQLNMFLGPKAATADLKALERAKRMSLVGATETDIRNATGWHKGADGEWRFEVPDDKLKVNAATGRLSHPEVEAAYPGMLKSFSVNVGDVNYKRPGNLGYMDTPNRQMGIFSPDPAERRSIAAHELQHLIQHHEGWSPGMSVQSPEIGLRLMEPGLRARKVDAKLKAAEGISRFDDSFIEPYFSANMRDRLGVEWGDLSRAEQAAFRNKIMKAAGDQIPQHHIDNYWKNRDIIADGETSPFSHYGQYRREAGEVEARNVQDRLNLTPRQREQIHPRTTEDIPRDEQWVAKRAPQYAWNELPDAEAVSRALDVAARPPVESLVYRAGDELSPEGSGYVAAPGKPSVVTIPGYGKVEARPVQPLLDAAEAYMRSVGRPGEHDVLAFPKLDEDRAGRIAEAYARMAHDPTDPKVAKAYAAMADETMAQYRALRDQGLDFHFLRDGEADPYARSPSLGYPDIIKNGRLTVFPTEQGFGSNELFDPSANPLLKKVGRVGDLEDATVNDAFRAVHDAYGHFGPGNPFFRAPGEERAWVAHSRMYSPEAIPAMTSETRGQNSWLNFGPHREHNKTALGADTIFADQKTGIMDDWTWALDPDALYPRRASGGRVNGAVAALAEPAEIDHPVARAMKVVYDDHPARIPQRLPTGKRATEDPLGDLTIDREALEKTPELFEQNVGLTRAYPNITKQEARYGSKRMADTFVEHVKNNLLWLHDQYAPELRDRAKLWYVGANKIATDWAEEYGHPVASVAGVLAALSPQKDWFMNVSLARRVLDTHAQHQDTVTTPEMTAALERVFPAAKYPELHGLLLGKRLGELKDPAEKAAWIRLYDEAHNDRSHQIVTPEGGFGDLARSMDGTPKGTGWGSIPEIAKAVGAIESGGDRAKLSKLMGERHKVRNFYNNILSPYSSKGDVTIDTHAVAAGLLRPLAGASLEVAHNFGSYAGKGLPQAGGSAITGVQGLYPLYAEAYRRAAKERGILPREMQSITWEAVRGLFPGESKKGMVDGVNQIWQKYRNGELSLDDARKQVHDYAGGIRKPDWAGSGVKVAGEGQDPAHAGELDQAGLHGLAPGGLGDRARDGAAGGPSPQDPLLTNYLVGRARGGRLKSIGAMATRWSPRPALMPDVDRDPVGNALATLRRRTSI